eukprot:13655647-Alexandrium_andersonii.AAC.1
MPPHCLACMRRRQTTNSRPPERRSHLRAASGNGQHVETQRMAIPTMTASMTAMATLAMATMRAN